jgi:hypothetical protein
VLNELCTASRQQCRTWPTTAETRPVCTRRSKAWRGMAFFSIARRSRIRVRPSIDAKVRDEALKEVSCPEICSSMLKTVFGDEGPDSARRRSIVAQSHSEPVYANAPDWSQHWQSKDSHRKATPKSRSRTCSVSQTVARISSAK